MHVYILRKLGTQGYANRYSSIKKVGNAISSVRSKTGIEPLPSDYHEDTMQPF